MSHYSYESEQHSYGNDSYGHGNDSYGHGNDSYGHGNDSYGHGNDHQHRGFGGDQRDEQSYFYKSTQSTTSSHSNFNPRYHAARQVFSHSKSAPRPKMTISPIATQEADKIKSILDEKHTDEGQNRVFDILASHPNATRQQIKRAFRNTYKEEMQESLSKAFKGSDEVLNALLNLPEDYDAKELMKSMKGLGTREATLTELLCSRTNDEVRDAGYSYKHWFGQSLKDDIAAETSGDYKAILMEILKCQRSDEHHVDHNQAMAIAQALADKKNDDYNFVQVLTAQNFPMILEIGNQYRSLAGKDFEDGIKKEFGGDPELAALTIYKVAHGKPQYFAELIHDSVAKGHHDVLLRVVGGREDNDLAAIRYAFEEMYHIPLDNFVQDTLTDKKSVDAREVALALIRRAH